MKKFICVLLALIMSFALCVSAFAADEEVAGTLADGTKVTKLVSEVVKTAEEADSEKSDELNAFFSKFDKDDDITVVAKGIVNFGGAFAECTEEVIEVPLPVPGVKVGDVVGVSLSNGTSETVECKEDDVVIIAFPKDAENIGYVIASAVKKTLDDGSYWMYLPTDNGTPAAGSPKV